MPGQSSLRLVVVAVLFLQAIGAAVISAHAQTACQVEQTPGGPGVEVTTMRRNDRPLAVEVARIAPDAPVEVRAVLASDSVGDEATAQETVTSMCARADGIVCVNGDFKACAKCREPFGGVVVGGRALRSFTAQHEQLSRTASGYTTERLDWSGSLEWVHRWRAANDPTAGVATTPGPEERGRLALSGLNVRASAADAVVGYTREWGGPAPAPAGSSYVLLLVEGAVSPGTMVVVAVEQANPWPIPANGLVLVGTGSGAQAVSDFWSGWSSGEADERSAALTTALSRAVAMSVGGHPVLLRDGVRTGLDESDPKVRDRHPRTLAGWTPEGALMLVTVDGRQPGYSEGMTLREAQELLLSLGASNGINLDGGGSTTFVGPCPSGTCVRNRPSGGRERPVTVALAVVPLAQAAATPAPAPAAPAPAQPTVQAPAVPAPPQAPAAAPAAPVAAPSPPAPASPAPLPDALARVGAPMVELPAAPSLAARPPIRLRAVGLPVALFATALWLSAVLAMITLRSRVARMV